MEEVNSDDGRSKIKSCKGCLYYSSLRKSKSKNPICLGFSRTLPQYSSYTAGDVELDASKRGSNLAGFMYVGIGYSVYLDNKNSSADSHQNEVPKLPRCIFGFEGLANKKPPVDHVPVPAHKNKEHGHATPQPQPPHVTREKYFNRFKRNASLVASEVARNLNRMGNYVIETLDDILNPSRRGPK